MSEIQDTLFSKILEKEYFDSLSKPRFLELDNLILFESHYRPESFERWKAILHDDVSPSAIEKIENTINHVHLDDLVTNEEHQVELGKYLQQLWLDALQNQFPTYNFECHVEKFEHGWELVMWRRR